ncbi:MAG: hypothetical protein J1E41_00385 [Ruminococcus sp.]|nr:hypothetical protein [Ruminococcus sp.]
MRRWLSVFAAIIIAILSTATAFCVDSLLFAKNVSVKNNRLFDVSLEVKSEKILCAATFTLKYDNSAVSFRNASSSLSNSQVKFSDKNGTVKVIFLCADGVRVNKKTQVVSVRFKSLEEGSSDIKISASDCVDNKAKNFKSPSGAVCKVKVSGTAGKSGTGVSGRKSKSTGNQNSKGDSEKSDSKNTDEENISPNGEDKGLLSAFDSTLNGESSPIFTVVCMALAILAAVVAVAIIIRNDKNRKEKAKNNIDDDD